MRTCLIAALALTPILSGPAIAGVYSDTLGKCLVASTSDEDKQALVRWIFASVTLHPAVASLSAVTPEQRNDINKAMGTLFERLLLVSCRKEASEALRYEGSMAMQASFQILGQVASVSMMSNPAVRSAFGQIGKYVDEKKLEELGAAK
ncbi:MAG TPA: hypothetical protein VLM18_06005 [Croceibacterium sp.]|nr:hypothetical protein [Croceibacterium sp.]